VSCRVKLGQWTVIGSSPPTHVTLGWRFAFDGRLLWFARSIYHRGAPWARARSCDFGRCQRRHFRLQRPPRLCRLLHVYRLRFGWVGLLDLALLGRGFFQAISTMEQDQSARIGHWRIHFPPLRARGLEWRRARRLEAYSSFWSMRLWRLVFEILPTG
jgi:hypothetical protein